MEDILAKSIIENITNQQQSLVILDGRISKLDEKMHTIINDMMAIESNMPIVQSSIEKLRQMDQEISALLMGYNRLSEKIDDITEKFDDYYKKNSFELSDLKKNFEEKSSSIMASLNDLGELHKSQWDENIAIDKRFVDLEKKLSSSLEDFKRVFNENIKNWLMEKIESRVMDDPKPIIDSMKSELYRKLDLVMIECQNAVLRATNISTQIPMIEKRIENLYLTLQKYEISLKQ